MLHFHILVYNILASWSNTMVNEICIKLGEREEVVMNVDNVSKQFYHEYITFNILPFQY